MLRKKYFTKEQLYQYALEKGIKGSWQDKWSQFGRFFFSMQDWGISVISFPQSKGASYIKAGDLFIYVGDIGENGEIKVNYDERVFGEGHLVGVVEMPTLIEVVEVGREEKGVVGTIWQKRVRDNGLLAREGFISYKEETVWEGTRKKFGIKLRDYRRFEVRGEKWAGIFEQWEKKREEIRKEFFFKEGLPLAKRFPPKRKLSLDEWWEYTILLGEHAYWLREQKEMEEEKEMKRLIWGQEELNESEWDGFFVVHSDSDSILGPLSLNGFFRFLAGDLEGVLERYVSKYSIPTPVL